MEVGDIHVGKQLSCVYTPQGLNPTTVINPFGFGEKAVCGVGHFNGAVLVGSGKFFPPLHPTASLMVTRPSPEENPLAIAPGIVHVRNSPLTPPTPMDVVIGDPLGPVGLTMVCGTITVEYGVELDLGALKKSTIGLKKNTGVKADTGAKTSTGAESQAGAEVRASAKAMAGPMSVSGGTKTPFVSGKIFTGRALGNKGFDIPHPTKENYRLRHVCVEGPENAVYIRGKLDGENVIKLPEYWKGLINYDTISVNLTPYGRKDSLYVKDIREDRIIISGDYLTNVKCFYQVWADRSGEPLIVEYKGQSPAEYPGDSSSYSIAGYDYDVRS
jgi:hypothetical protein